MRVLFLDLDTLRPDHLGCYGYHRDTSPNIDRIAAGGVRFENYYTPDAPCLPSRAALVSGMFGIRTGAVGHGATSADRRLQGSTRSFQDQTDNCNLWNAFRKGGLHTCTISPFAQRHSSYWFLAGMNEVHNHAYMGGMESAEHVTPTALKWLDDNAAGDNWLLHINYWDPHTPYRAPGQFGNPFKDDPLPAWLTREVLDQHRKLAGPHTARDNGMYTGADDPQYPRHPNDVRDMEQLRRCIDGYDCGIRYMDGHIGQLLSMLAAKGVLEDTAIIVTSDHGENFGELGIYSEHGTADHITCRVPMIISWPGMKRGHVDTGLHYNLDLLPTVSELLKTETSANWDGRSFSSSLRGEDAGRAELVLSQMAHVCQRAVRWDRWLYIRTYHDGLHPHFGEDMLFDLCSDPHETTDLSARHPQIVHEAKARLHDWHDAMMSKPYFGNTVDPLRTVLAEGGPFHAVLSPQQYTQYMIRLLGTGREDGARALVGRHPELAPCLAAAREGWRETSTKARGEVLDRD